MSKWKILRGSTIQDLSQWIREETTEGQGIQIGCDSLQTGRYTQFVTVLVILTPSKGGRVAYRREVVPRMNDLRQRLLAEVQRSIDTGLELSGISSDLTIHIDANAQEEHMSSKYVEELAGYCVGMGFKSLIKPEAWASTTVADHVVRSQGKVPRELRLVKRG